MKISYDRQNRRFWLSQKMYIEKVLERFSVSIVKAINSPLAGYFKLVL